MKLDLDDADAAMVARLEELEQLRQAREREESSEEVVITSDDPLVTDTVPGSSVVSQVPV